MVLIVESSQACAVRVLLVGMWAFLAGGLCDLRLLGSSRGPDDGSRLGLFERSIPHVHQGVGSPVYFPIAIRCTEGNHCFCRTVLLAFEVLAASADAFWVFAQARATTIS